MDSRIVSIQEVKHHLLLNAGEMAACAIKALEQGDCYKAAAAKAISTGLISTYREDSLASRLNIVLMNGIEFSAALIRGLFDRVVVYSDGWVRAYAPDEYARLITYGDTELVEEIGATSRIVGVAHGVAFIEGDNLTLEAIDIERGRATALLNGAIPVTFEDRYHNGHYDHVFTVNETGVSRTLGTSAQSYYKPGGCYALSIVMGMVKAA